MPYELPLLGWLLYVGSPIFFIGIGVLWIFMKSDEERSKENLADGGSL